MLKLVPNELREASYALGVPRWRTILKVVVPTAMAGIVTAIMLAIARVIGETAPLLLVVGATDVINMNAFSGAQASLPVYVFGEWGKGVKFSEPRAWAAALTLIAIVMLLNLVARLVARLTAQAKAR
jgi:phosphate transport system permease protein